MMNIIHRNNGENEQAGAGAAQGPAGNGPRHAGGGGGGGDCDCVTHCDLMKAVWCGVVWVVVQELGA